MKNIGYLIFAVLFAVAVYSLGVSFIALSAGFAGAAFSSVFVYKFWSADKLELRKSQTRSRSLASVMNGRAKTRDDWLPDARVQGGMIFNRKDGRIEITGKLSNDSLDRVFR
jgi:hypothetical protein